MNSVLERVYEIGIIPVIAFNSVDEAIPLCKALMDGGLPAAEVTFRTACAEECIKKIHEELPNMLLGAGTVLTVDQADRAMAAGASFIVAPGFDPEVCKHVIAKGGIMMPGTCSAGEMQQAMNMGCEALKFFPAEANGGVGMLKNIGAALKGARWMCTGGVNAKNVNDYLGYDQIFAVGGTWMCKSDVIKAGDWAKITAQSKEAVDTMLGLKLMHVGINTGNEEEAAKVADVFFNAKTHGVKPDAVGQTACRLAEMAGIEVPYDTKVLIHETDDTSHDCPWANEKLTTLLGMYKAETLDEAFDICYKLVLEGGAGHSAALYIDPTEEEKITRFGLRMKAGRILINQPTSFGGSGDLYNFGLAPSLTLGPGSVGHSAFMGNTHYEQLLDIKTVTLRKENMLWLQLPKKVYYKTGCTPVALREMKEVYNFKRAFIITDSTLYQLGACDAIINQLRDMGIETAEFFDIRVDPQIQDAMKGLPKMHEFEPDVIIAVGGGSAIDTAKIMWIMYEHPEEGFLDMATTFLDIRKRIRFFPQIGKKAKLVCIPTTAGTGSECTPFTIISDANTGMKWPLIGYEMMPEMAIVDADNMMKLPPRATQASGYDVLTHAVEAYVSTFATEYTNGMCRDATKMVFDYLPRAYYSAFRDAKPDPVAREKMANASALAGIAFANAFLGINHSLSHKLGGWFHIPHGTANALLFPFVCRFNAQRHPYKMGTFSQYKYPQAFERYVELGELIGVKGKTDEQTFENWIKACEQLKKDIDIPETILDWLLEAHPEKTAEEWETEFLAAVDQMSEWAFHDACTGFNPVYPTIAELKGCYLKAFYGEKKYAEKYGDIWEVPVTLPTDTHAAYPMGLCAALGVEKPGGFT